jgi:5-methylcytosine-specific restriction protein A
MPHKPPLATSSSAPRASWKHTRESRHARGYGTAWDKLRGQIMRRDNGLCQACLRKGRVAAGNEVDPITPKAKGGSDDPSNLEVICKPCHVDKTAREMGRRRKPRIGLDGRPIWDD